MTTYAITATSQKWRNERDNPSAGGACNVVQLYNGNGDSMVSGDDTYAVFSVEGFISPQQFDTEGLFDGTSTITITAEMAGYWEWDAFTRFGYDAASTGYQLTIAIEASITGRIAQGYQQLDPGGTGVTIQGEMDVEARTTGVNLVEGDEIKLLMVAFATNPIYTKAFIRGRRICDTLPVLPYAA